LRLHTPTESVRENVVDHYRGGRVVELHRADLEDFSVDSKLDGLAEATIKGYVD
jgi:hypothetical protein